MLPPYRTAIDPAWIDYNGHLRDAFYGLVLSYATDDMMDHIGVDAAYRERTRCTLYTLEVHIHYLHEVKATDLLEVRTDILDADRKRIHAGCSFFCARVAGPVAVAEAMLLHVHQGEKPSSAPFPAEIAERIALYRHGAPELVHGLPGSRKIELTRR